ncbi:2OG-Fe dioxygenase family protein [Micromonospora sp. NBC_01699]|uniref:2OG-Fe dioxygenase family protein n=1 Tax=Micromonospora sp. NBC_01699 TaxID=2975984 RepID=UPI002E29A762|nr:2OG-Fe dioxygenase family protein [Micromonospora sp. NBC_01699]
MDGSRPETTLVLPDRPDANADSLAERGFARGRAADFGFSADEHPEGFRQLAAAFADLPPDSYAPGSNRFRRYSQLVYLPWNDGLFWIPGVSDDVYGSVAEYYQGRYNPDFTKLRRRFPEVPDELRVNPLLLQILRSDVARVQWLEELTRTPIYIGLHMVKLAVHNPGEAAVSSPNCLHQDGGATMFTFAHLVDCHNVVGGENVIATPESAGRQPEELAPEAIHAQFTLTQPLDTYVVHDHRVSHHVSAVRLGDESPGPGQRSILIIGVAPFVPDF